MDVLPLYLRTEKYPMSAQRIGLLFGGKSPEHEVSIVSARNIYNAIDRSRFEVTLIGIARMANGISKIRITCRTSNV